MIDEQQYSKKVFLSIGEVSEILGLPDSKIRTRSNFFKGILDVPTNARGKRQFTQDNLKTLKTICFLMDEKGMRREAVYQMLSSAKKAKVDPVKKTNVASDLDAQAEAVRSLQEIKQSLLDICKYL